MKKLFFLVVGFCFVFAGCGENGENAGDIVESEGGGLDVVEIASEQEEVGEILEIAYEGTQVYREILEQSEIAVQVLVAWRSYDSNFVGFEFIEGGEIRDYHESEPFLFDQEVFNGCIIDGVVSPEGKKCVPAPLCFGDDSDNVWVYDSEARLAETVAFCGTMCRFMGGQWVNDDILIYVRHGDYWPLSGEFDCGENWENCGYASVMMVFDMKNRKYEFYKGPVAEKRVDIDFYGKGCVLVD